MRHPELLIIQLCLFAIVAFLISQSVVLSSRRRGDQTRHPRVSHRSAEECPRRQIERNYEALEVEPGRYPFTARLYKKDKLVCACFAVNMKDAVTAASCVVESGRVVSPQDLTIVLGDESSKSLGMRLEFNVKRIKVHESYTIFPNYTLNDVAMLTLPGPDHFSGYGHTGGPGELSDLSYWDHFHEEREPTNNSDVFAIGWGSQRRDGVERKLPRRFEAKVTDCKRGSYPDHPGLLCFEPTVGFCYGDFGAPLVMNYRWPHDPGSLYVAIGIMTPNAGLCAGQISYSMRTSHYAYWIWMAMRGPR